MQTSHSKRFLAVAALAVAAMGAATVAHARSDVTWSIGISSPGVYVQPPPVYYPPPPPVYYQPPPPVYYRPRPVYVQPAPVYVQPRVVYAQPPAYGYYYNSPAWRRGEWEPRHHWKRKHHDHDWDRDGRDWDRD